MMQGLQEALKLLTALALIGGLAVFVFFLHVLSWLPAMMAGWIIFGG